MANSTASSMRPPKKPPITPMVMPITPDTMVTVTPISIEMRQPQIRRGKIVATELVGAEDEVGIVPLHPEGHEQAAVEILGKWVVRHDQRREDRAEQREADDDRPDPGAGALPAPAGTGVDRDRGTHARSRGSRTAFSRSETMVRAT